MTLSCDFNGTFISPVVAPTPAFGGAPMLCVWIDRHDLLPSSLGEDGYEERRFTADDLSRCVIEVDVRTIARVGTLTSGMLSRRPASGSPLGSQN